MKMKEVQNVPIVVGILGRVSETFGDWTNTH